MDHFLKGSTKVLPLVFAILLMSGCSSSSVDSSGEGPSDSAVTDGVVNENPPDVATDAPPPEASTDPAPVAQASPTDAPPADAPPVDAPPPDMATTAPEAPPVDAPPVADTNVAAAVTENPSLAQAEAPKALEASSNPPPAPLAESPKKDMEPAPVSGDATRYTVKRGDTLMKIAFENYGDLYRWKDILDANSGKIKGANDLAPGTVLMLSGAGMVTIERNGEAYLIKQGDTLGLISNEVYGTKMKWKKLWENNRQLIKNPNRIYAGFNLYYIPESRMTQSMSSKEGAEEAPRDPAATK